MTAQISTSVLDALITLARASEGREVCGLLTGEGSQISGHVPSGNVADDPVARFEIDPVVLIGALKAERSGGPAIIGCYHSHPSGDPAPSRTDARDAAPDGTLWLIMTAQEAGLWRAVADGARFGRFDPMPWSITTPSGLHDDAGFSKRPGEPHIRSLDA